MGDGQVERVELPVIRGEPVCPAAFPIRGASRAERGVICQVMRESVEDDPGVGMSAGQLGVLRDSQGGVYLNLKSDPSTVTAFCHGDAVPVVHDEQSARASYTSCPVWVAEKERIAEGRGELTVEREPEPVAMGVSSDQFKDPWAAARQGLDELAPKKAA